MADMAYLYTDDRPDAWEEPEEGYCFSKWLIPLAWFFFFKPEDVRLIDVRSDDSIWQEVRITAEKGHAVELFEIRKPLLMSLIDDRIDGASVEAFVSTVSNRPERFLLINPNEVLGGVDCAFDDDEGQARRISEILANLGDGSCPTNLARELTVPYVKEFSTDPNRCRGQILGYIDW